MNARAIVERDTASGVEVLLQVRDRAGEARGLEFPGGQLDEFEPVLAALAREVREETGLTLSRVLGDTNRTVSSADQGQVECLTPFFVYQTLRGPVDSTGFFFRIEAHGDLTKQGDGASGHRWVGVAELTGMFEQNPGQFDWLTRGALTYYLAWCERQARDTTGGLVGVNA